MDDITIHVPISSHDLIKALMDYDDGYSFSKKDVESIILHLDAYVCKADFTRLIIKKLQERLEDE